MGLSTVDSDAGRKANSNGKDFENLIECKLKEKGYILWESKKPEPEKWYKTQVVIGTKPAGGKLRVDFQLSSGTVIEAKWQSSSGSVEEKLPYAVYSLDGVSKNAIVILDGGGVTQGMQRHLKEIADSLGTITVCNFNEFCELEI